jgi:hypothetical protein
MRILLRDLDTGTFFRSEKIWTKDPREALDFLERARAIQVAHELKLKNAELFVVADDGTPIFGAWITD